MGNQKPGRYLKCERHNCYVSRDGRRFVHRTPSTVTKSAICDSIRFLVVDVVTVDKETALVEAENMGLVVTSA